MKVKYRSQILITLVLSFVTMIANADPFATAAISLKGGVVPPNGKFRITLDSLIHKRYYDVTCDIENPNYNSSDPVILKLTGHWSAHTSPSPTGGVGTITVNGRGLIHSQVLINQFENKYKATDVWVGDTAGYPYLFLVLDFENYHESASITVKNCIATYMVD